MKNWLGERLWRLSDRLCAHRVTFPAGNWLGELGWKLHDKPAVRRRWKHR